MNIDRFIQREAPEYNDGNLHDIAYAKAIREAYITYKDMDLADLEKCQVVARQQHDSTHSNVAAAMVLYELISEKKK